MKTGSIAKVAACFWCVGMLALAQSRPSEPGTLVTSFVAAWNAHDPEVFAKLFAPDADWVTASGSLLHGRESIRAYLSNEHAGWAKHTRMQCFNIHVRSVNSDTAAIFFEWEISAAENVAAAFQARRGNNLLIAIRSESGWVIAAGQVARKSEPG